MHFDIAFVLFFDDFRFFFFIPSLNFFISEIKYKANNKFMDLFLWIFLFFFLPNERNHFTWIIHSHAIHQLLTRTFSVFKKVNWNFHCCLFSVYLYFIRFRRCLVDFQWIFRLSIFLSLLNLPPTCSVFFLKLLFTYSFISG